MVLLVIFIFLLFVISGFFAAGETALTFSSRAKINQWVSQRVKNADLARELQEKPNDLISSLLAGSNLINIMIATIAGGWFAKVLDIQGQAIASVLMGTFILIYIEILPKMIALQYSEKFLLHTSKIMKCVILLFKPLNYIVNKTAYITLKLIRVPQQSGENAMEEELRGYIDLYTKKYSRNIEERVMLKSILDLTKIKIGEIMVHRKDVQMLNADDSIDHILDLVKSSPFTRLPVWKGERDNITCIVHVKSLLEYLLESGTKKNDLDLTRIGNKPWFAPQTTNVLEQLNAFKLKQEHFVIAVDEYGMFLGIVTLEDVLEEIVGDITDEFDLKIGKVLKSADDSILVAGNCNIRELNRYFDLHLPEDQASTVSGLLLNLAQAIPEVGDVYYINKVYIEILKKKRYQILLVKIVPDKT